jgi:UDP-N-acetylglucosamine/UDP-N-acetylgalactosamine 4-epimerase
MQIPLTDPILVSGGAGFIGSHVCEALLAAGARVRCLDNFATSAPENILHLRDHPSFELMEADIRVMADCEKAVEGMGYLVHLAALGSVPRSIADPLASHATNLTGYLNMLEAARKAGIRRLVYASSSSVYGDSRELPKREEHVGRPLSPYAVTKAANEIYGMLYHRLHGFPTIGLRFFNVFGERQDPAGPYAAAIPRFIHAFLQHRSPEVHGDGLQSRDFTYVGNAVQAVLAALSCTNEPAIGKVFNIAFGERTSLLDLITLIRAELARLDPAIGSLSWEHVEARQGDVRDSLADIGLARGLLGFNPAFDLQQGLQRAVPWYVQHFGGIRR